MTLRGARIALGPNRAVRRDLAIRGGRVVDDAEGGPPVLDMSGHLLLPGLINAHDHLEFNLFPRLGHGPYPNATAWAEDIYRPEESPIREHLQVPKETRLYWGGLKNLLSGVTTVCHHNPYDAKVFGRAFPVRVLRRFGWAHSLRFSPDVAECRRRTPKGWPFIVHLAESTDRQGRAEVAALERMGVLDRWTVIVHGVGVVGRGLALARRRGASIIWCPSSNAFLLGRTLRRGTLDCGMPIALGSDSALTGAGDLLDELQFARRTSKVTAERLYRMVTTDAARVLRLPHGCGTLQAGAPADVAAIRDEGGTPAEQLAKRAEPRLVIAGGRIRLSSPCFAPAPRHSMRMLHVEGRSPVLVDADVSTLFRSAARALGEEIRLAGRRIVA